MSNKPPRFVEFEHLVNWAYNEHYVIFGNGASYRVTRPAENNRLAFVWYVPSIFNRSHYIPLTQYWEYLPADTPDVNPTLRNSLIELAA